MKIGVLALQGGFYLHKVCLSHVGIESIEVKNLKDLENIDGLIFPGGESSTHLKLLNLYGLKEGVGEFVFDRSKKIFGTCAGLILLATEVKNPDQDSFKALDIVVVRNGYGSQLDSFEGCTDSGVYSVFIRAPRIERVLSEKCKVIDTLNNEPVMVRQDNVIACSHHPELARNFSLYEDIFIKNRI